MVRDSFNETPVQKPESQEHRLQQPELSQRPGSAPSQQEVRHDRPSASSDTMRHFPSVTMDCNGLHFTPAQQAVAEALGLKPAGRKCDNRVEGARPGEQEKLHRSGIEKSRRTEGTEAPQRPAPERRPHPPENGPLPWNRTHPQPGSDAARLPSPPEQYRQHEPGNHTRSLHDWDRFYRSQTRSNNCLPTSMSMMYADLVKGRPANDQELRHIENVTHVGAHGPYTGSANDIARQARQLMPGLNTQSYESLDRRSLAATLDRHLAEGHTAIVGIKSPYSSGNHYIYVAGKDNHGNYIIGDSGRHGGGKLGKTISQEDLLNRMMARHGGSRMVAGWMERAGSEQTREQPAQPSQSNERPYRHAERPNSPSDHANFPFDRIAGNRERREIRLRDAIVNVPKDLDPSKPIHFITHFNGFSSSHEGDYRRDRLNEAMANAPKNTVFISARWQDQEGGRNPSHHEFDRHGGVRGVLNNVFQSVPEVGRRQLQANDTIGLVGFSAGYNAVASTLADRSLSNRITDIVMLDSPSSAVQKYLLNNAEAFARGEKRFVSVVGNWQSNNYHHLAQAMSDRLQHLGLDPRSYMHSGRADDGDGGRKGLTFLYSGDRHLHIPGKYYKHVAF